MRRLVKPEEFQIDQVKTKGDDVLKSQSKKADFRKAYEIIVSRNVGYLEAYDSISFVHMEFAE